MGKGEEREDRVVEARGGALGNGGAEQVELRGREQVECFPYTHNFLFRYLPRARNPKPWTRYRRQKPVQNSRDLKLGPRINDQIRYFQHFAHKRFRFFKFL